MKTRIVRRCETRKTDLGTLSSDWRYYIQERKKVFGLFGNSIWLESSGPYITLADAKREIERGEKVFPVNGTEDVVYEA